MGCRKKKGRIDRRLEGKKEGRKESRREGRKEKLPIPMFSMNVYSSPDVKYYKICPKVKVLDPLTKPREKEVTPR